MGPKLFYGFEKAFNCIAIAGLLSIGLGAGLASAQAIDDQSLSNAFDLLEVEDSDDTFVLKIEPEDLLTFAPVVASAVPGRVGHLLSPSAHFIRPDGVENGSKVQAGVRLQFHLEFESPPNSTFKRLAMLFSDQASPESTLSEDALLAMYDDQNFMLDWSSTIYDDWLAGVWLTFPDRFTSSDAGNGLRRSAGSLQLPTAGLKPGNYHILFGINRKVDGEVVEEDRQRFHFTVVDTPIHVMADEDDLYEALSETAASGPANVDVLLSDWAVFPAEVRVRSDLAGISFTGNGDHSGYIDESIFDFVISNGAQLARRTGVIDISVTDGLGRTAKWRQNLPLEPLFVDDLSVELPGRGTLGKKLHGSVTYPPGFNLTEAPQVALVDGFEWTSSDKTTFVIHLSNTDADLDRDFRLKVTGTLRGSDHETELSWYQFYYVSRPKPTKAPVVASPKPDDKKQRREDRRRSFKDAFVNLMIGKPGERRAYNDDGSFADSDDNCCDDTSNYELVDIQEGGNWADDDDDWDGLSEERIDELTEQFFGSPDEFEDEFAEVARTENTPDTSSPQATADGGQQICGTYVAGHHSAVGIRKDGWTIWDEEDEIKEAGQYHKLIVLVTAGIPYDGEPTRHFLRLYKDSCVYAGEDIPTHYGFDEQTKHYSNGGRKLVLNEFTHKEWDRPGNLTLHFKRANHQAPWETICNEDTSLGNAIECH